jgi:nucleoside-diphosphate-sugar epimerase
MKKILIIGGAGYIGTVIIQNFLKAGYFVRNLDNLMFNNSFAIKKYSNEKNYEFIHGDLRSNLSLSHSIKDIQNVIILAGIVGDPLSKKYPEETIKINELGVMNCLNYLNNKNIQKVIFISTCSNYGLIKENELADESSKLNPLSLYAKSKVNIENFILKNKKTHDYCPVILRFATAFGLSPRMRFDLTVNQFTHELLIGNELEVYDPETWRPYCHVDDFSEIIDKIMKQKEDKIKNEVFNVGSDENNFTKEKIVDLIIKKLPNSKFKIVRGGFDKRNYKVNFNKIKTLLNHKYKSLHHGVDEIIKAVKKDRFNDYETNKNKYGNYIINK